MRKTGLFAAALVATVSTLSLSAPVQAQEAGQKSAVYDELKCDRACLLGILGEYMGALRTATPSAVPIADKYVFTENNVSIPLGKGLWGTVENVDQVGLEVADAQTQNAAWFGSVIENGDPAILAVRIHVKNGRIDEIETVVHRKTSLPAPFGDTTNIQHDPEFNAILPVEQRRSRARLKAIADSYFDTVEVNDGQVFAPFAQDCGRLENAISTTTRGEGAGAANIVDGCEAQFKLGLYRINKRVRERLYSIIDEERGIVVASGFFDHANEWNTYKLTDGRDFKTALNWPNSITLLEAFRIKDAEISRVEAVFTYVPHFMHNPFAGPASTSPAVVTSADQCGKQCLTSLTSKVMAAYPKRGEWKNLPWAEKVGYEENSVGLQINEGLWGSTTAVDAKPLVIADEKLGRTLWLGRIEENGQPAWGAFTISAHGDKIGRIEAVVRRKEYGAPYAEPVNGPSFSVLPVSQRTGRASMLAAVDRFYAAANTHNGTVPADFGKDCEWGINGQTVAPCAIPFSNRLLQGIEQIRDIKVIAVDEERGLVAVSTYEDFTGSVQRFTDASGATFEDSLPYPRTLQVVELFRFVKGKVERIDAYTSELPYGVKPR